MIDPLVRLSFAIQGNKGVYAMLLGSGVSRSAGIPTGWEVVLDLSRKLAAAHGEDMGKDAAEWFRKKYGKYPDYSELLDALCKTPAERQQLLRSYFEATEVEREQGLKQPTNAHRAVATLMAQGYIRLVLTTNFDRLLERALEEQGVAPVVISTADATEGALPLAHQTACIIKLHGDYLDSRIKNTPTELAAYDARLDKLLDQILDQFGLVVCGWSAQWDTALRAAIERSSCRRFTLFWAARGKPTSEADKLIALRRGTTIDISDADGFLSKVQQLVEGIEQSNRPHPQSVEAVAALTKRLLSDPNQLISLSDLVHEETESALKAIEAATALILQHKGKTDGAFVAKSFERYRGAIERVQALAIQGGAWGGAAHLALWPQIIQRLATPPKMNPSNAAEWLRLYPAMVLIYSIGLAAAAQDRLANFREVLYRPKFRDHSETTPLITRRFWADMHDPIKSIKEHERQYTPRSEHLFVVLREPVRRFLPDDKQYEDAFDQVEYLIALAYLDLDNEESRFYGPWTPPGRFAWKARSSGHSRLYQAEAELKAEGAGWAPLRAGFFSGQPERAADLQIKLRDFVGKLNYH